MTLDKFSAPLHISSNIDPASVPALLGLLGVYHLGDDGSLNYAGGRWSEAGLSAELNALGKLALVSYDKTFKDVPADYWASDVIKQLAARQIITGVSADAFAPGASVTRAEFIAMLVRALGLDPSNPPALNDASSSKWGAPMFDGASSSTQHAPSFSDVSSSAWYADEVAVASAAGIVKGRADGTFGGGDVITREEMAVMLVKARTVMNGAGDTAEGGGQSLGLAVFKDSDKIAPWAQKAVSEAVALGLLYGRDGGVFAPKDLLTRAESAQVIWKLLEQQQ
ncbi:Endo-1,4-beta-xylanase A precursor [compost metagenome]